MTAGFLPLALTTGSWILVGVMAMVFAGVVLGLYTRHGTQIREHPRGGQRLGGGGGSAEHGDMSGKDQREPAARRGSR